MKDGRKELELLHQPQKETTHKQKAFAVKMDYTSNFLCCVNSKSGSMN